MDLFNFERDFARNSNSAKKSSRGNATRSHKNKQVYSVITRMIKK